MLKNVKKDFSEITEDLHMSNGMVVRLRTSNTNEPKVIEVQFNCYATPSSDKSTEEYEKCISNIRRKFSLFADKYMKRNAELVQNRKICDVVFTTGNLKKGYCKSVSMTLYVRQKGNLQWNELKRFLKNGLGEMTEEVVDCLRSNEFTCKKSKKEINIR